MSDSRQYPERPIVGVGAVIVDDGKVVLIRRKYEPLKGHWSLPGGMVEIGEPLETALTREMQEETALVVDVGPVIEVFDRIMRDEQRRVRYHFVLIDYLCWPSSGTLRAGSDVDDAIWADPSALAAYSLTEKATSVIQRGLTLAREAPRPVR
ncbi:MAG TPA: NUDIX hydrolase [Vicinamibacterales bacterium]|nr:NUDIX hydrolase [Vicinamibacterales bacterium]